MKKFFMAAALAVMSLTASAQVYVGGGLGFGVSSYSPDGGDSSSKTGFAVKPEVGYYINDNLAVGVQFGIGSTKVTDIDAVTTWNADVYGRYNFVNGSVAKLGGELFLGYGSYGKDMGANFHVGIRPVITVACSEKFNLIARCDLLRWAKDNEDAGKGSHINVGVFGNNPDACSQVELGVEFKF